MSGVHRVRLHGPWLAEVIESCSSTQDGAERPFQFRTQVPNSWIEQLGRDFRGCVRYRRTFHRPTNLSDGQVVELFVASVERTGTVRLNDQLLGTVDRAQEFRQDVAAVLRSFNELVVDVTLPPGVDPATNCAGGLIGSVALDIYDDC